MRVAERTRQTRQRLRVVTSSLREEGRQGPAWTMWSDVQTAVLCVWTRTCSFTMSGCFTPPPCGSSRRSSGSRSRPSAWACRRVRPHVKIPHLGVSDLDASSMYCLDFSLLVHYSHMPLTWRIAGAEAPKSMLRYHVDRVARQRLTYGLKARREREQSTSQ